MKRQHRIIAISVALTSTVMAITKIKDDNLVQTMVQEKTDAIDTWNEFQAKRLKHHLALNAIDQNELLSQIVGRKASQPLLTRISRLKQDVERYEKESEVLMQTARDHERLYQELNRHDDQFDLSDACLSLSLMLLAVSALTTETWLIYTSWGLLGIGFFFGLAGFLGWNTHPDWLIRFLS